MFKSYLISAWRTLQRNRIYAAINILGLALALCTCLVIGTILRYEFSFNRNIPAGSEVYRINSFERFLKDEREQLSPVNGICESTAKKSI